MKRSELIEWLSKPDGNLNTEDPEVQIWCSSYESLSVLSVYSSDDNLKIYIDVQLD